MTCVLFIFSNTSIFYLHHIVQVGFGEHLFILLGCIAIYYDRFLKLLLIVALSCLVKESIGMLLIPSYLIVTAMSERWQKALLKTSILAAVFISLHLCLRSGILFYDKTDLATYTSFYTLEYVRFVYNYWGGVAGAIYLIAGTFGPLWFIAILGAFIAPQRLKALTILPLLAILQIALATDVMRMVGVGVPIVLVLAAFALSRLDKKSNLILVGLSCFYSLYLNHHGNKIIIAGSFLLTLVLLALSSIKYPEVPLLLRNKN